ncbi:MAG: hypothetical protein JNL11_07095 [Bdellovibrionaceae bacterium]|nr:hypothetical protein [Pseudobdellovibrionaceae bacterium]
MKKRLVIFTSIFLIAWLTSCKPADTQQTGTVSSVNTDSLAKMSGSACLNDEQLVEVDYGSANPVHQTITTYKAFGFLKGTGLCALSEDYNRDGLGRDKFSLILYDNCLPNGSLWLLKTFSTQNNKLYADFYEFGSGSDKVTRLKADHDVRLRDLMRTLGMRFYKCVSI